MHADITPLPVDHLARCGLPDSVALITPSQSITYAALDKCVGHYAAGLSAKGLTPGHRVATWLPKTPLACMMPLVAARAGLVHVPINPVLRRAQVAHILADSGAALLLTDAGRAQTLEDGDVPAACALLDVATWEMGNDALAPSKADPDDLAALLYTSGSTGRPKGVMLSHTNLWLGAQSVAQFLRLSADDRVLAVLPLSFDYGQNQLLSTWAAGGAVVPLDYLRASEVARAVARHQITTLAGVPPLWVQLLETDWSAEATAALRRLTNSGGALGVPLVRALRARFPDAALYPMYGLTEAFRSTYLDPALVDAHPDSVGTAIPFAEVMVVRADGSAAAVDEPGELVHAGPLVAQGYWQDSARTAQRFRPAPAWSKSGGIAVWSGDTVVADAAGRLRFVGRDDEMIKTSGTRVSPGEIEAAAMDSGVVAEAVALGRPHARLGAEIVLIARATANAVDADTQLRSHLRRELPLFMQPAALHWCDDLPRNANGKLDRAALKAEHGQ